MSLPPRIKTFVDNLSPHERDELLAELLRDNGAASSRDLNAAELGAAERWLWRRVESAKSPRLRNSRMRIWLVFLFLRYGGMHLQEIFNLRLADLDMAAGAVKIRRGDARREVFFSRAIAGRIRHGLDLWPGAAGLDAPFLCDSSLVRRALANCARACGLKVSMLNARNLRKNRARELELAGLPANLVNMFLGRLVAQDDFNYARAQKILRFSIHNEQPIKTSARNSFYGQIVSVAKNGILAEAVLETAGGLRVKAVITETSRKSLQLEQGHMATALVKAPWVKIVDKEAAFGECNAFAGVIEEIKSDGNATEILVLLPQGNLVCALYARAGEAAPLAQKGMKACAVFSPLSVILTAG